LLGPTPWSTIYLSREDGCGPGRVSLPPENELPLFSQ
jgi:hypothetical protein